MLKFDPEKHVYTYDGQPTPSVTQALKLGGLIDDKWFDDVSRARGSAVHKAIFLHMQNDLDFDSLHPMIKPYVEGFFQFEKMTRFKPIIELCEVSQFHPVHRYAGTPDVVGILNGRHIVLDFKTGAAPTARYQTAAYAEFPRIKIYQPDRFDLRLFPDGRPKLNQHKSPDDFTVFLAALTIAKTKS